MRSRRVRLALLAAAAVVGAAALAAVLVLERSSQGSSPSRAARGDGARPAAAFQLQTVDGHTFSLAASRGKVVVVEFLAPGCPECAADVAGLSEAAVRFGARAKVLIVDVGGIGDNRALRNYYRGELAAAEQVLIAADRGFRVAQTYRVRTLGQTFVVDPHGRIRWQGRWAGNEELLFGAIKRASA